MCSNIPSERRFFKLSLIDSRVVVDELRAWIGTKDNRLILNEDKWNEFDFPTKEEKNDEEYDFLKRRKNNK